MHHSHVGQTDQRSVTRSPRGALLGLLTVALLALAPGAAHAATGFSVTPSLPATVSIGATATGSIDITDGGASGSNTICNAGDSGPCDPSKGITLVPSCGALNSLGCTAADPGVFAIRSPATGDPDSVCAGRSFTVAQIDATYGTVNFTPTSPVVLPAGSTCRINFTFTVEHSPLVDARPAVAGRQTFHRVEATARTEQDTIVSSQVTGGPVTVTLAAPLMSDTDPDSPANHNTPRVKGTAAAGSQVLLYTEAGCSGPIAAQGSAAAFESPGLTAAVVDDATTTFYATATDVADGGVSPCSSGLTYVEDSTPPAPPVLNDTDPDSPANDNLPRVKGTAAADSIVKLYTDAACTAFAAQGSASTFASSGVPAAVANDSTTTFRATATDTAGNASGCSATPVTYVEDSTPPAATSVPTTTPASPSGDNAPRVSGTAPTGTTIRIYTDSNCAATVAASGGATLFAPPGFQVTVPSNSATRFYATASDAAGNVSPCSTGSVAYVEDSLAPPVPSAGSSEPTSPSTENSPRIRGVAESGSTVRLYADAACAGAARAVGSAAQYASPGLLVSVADDSTTTYYARATDAAGNASACSGGVSYVEDSRPPQTAIDDTPATGSTPTFSFASEPGSTFECRIDDGSFAACTSPYIVADGLAAGAHTFEVRAVDAAGNRAPAVVRGFTVSTGVVTPPPPPPPPPPLPPPLPQPGCLGIKGTVYVGTTAANSRTGGAKTDIMFGLAGNDALRGASGVDCLYGADGSDVLRGGAGADRLFGGTGNDRLDGESGNDRLGGGTGNDRLDGESGNDRLSGEAGDDRLAGGAGADSLAGAAGRDRLTDRRGRDRLSGGAGNDTIDARDTTLPDRRSADRIVCGAGRDIVRADQRDIVARDCERVVRRRLPAVAPYY